MSYRSSAVSSHVDCQLLCLKHDNTLPCFMHKLIVNYCGLNNMMSLHSREN